MATLSVHATAANSPRTEIKAGRHTILIDEPPLFGGNDEAPSPVETLLAARGGGRVKYDWVGMVLCCLIVCAALVLFAAAWCLVHDPDAIHF